MREIGWRRLTPRQAALPAAGGLGVLLLVALAAVQCAGPAFVATPSSGGFANADSTSGSRWAGASVGAGGSLATQDSSASGAASGSAVTASSGASGNAGSPTSTATATPAAGATATPTRGTSAPSVSPITPTRSPSVGPTASPTRAATSPPTQPPTPAPTPPPLGSCPIFPASNVWNRDISGLPVASNSAAMITAIGAAGTLHPDFSSTGYGIPFNVVGAGTPKTSVSFDYADESDAGPYPIPSNPKIEGGSDRHLLMVDTSDCRLYELYAAANTGSGWTAGSGAIWSLQSNALRPAGWTSADAAGLPILPGLARYDEVAAGAILHALRFTAASTCAGYIYPARHQAGSGSCASKPPMGLRLRLKSSVDISAFGYQARVVLQALKRYGMILADNGTSWYVTGAPDPRWNDDVLHVLNRIRGSDFEVVDTSGLANG